jgi:hypothetical protein
MVLHGNSLSTYDRPFTSKTKAPARNSHCGKAKKLGGATRLAAKTPLVQAPRLSYFGALVSRIWRLLIPRAMARDDSMICRAPPDFDRGSGSGSGPWPGTVARRPYSYPRREQRRLPPLDVMEPLQRTIRPTTQRSRLFVRTASHYDC